MKASILYKNFLSLTLIAFAYLLMVSISSCAHKMSFERSPVVPAATGSVKIKKSDNDNYIIDVKTENLAAPDRLTPPRKVYVVWMESDRNAAKNMGMIKSETGLFSSTLKGDMKAAATVKPTGIYITAEDDGNVQYPGSQVVLRTR